MSKKILFFIDSITAGGRERRAVELLIYLKRNTEFEIQLVLTEKEIHYNYIYDLSIPIFVLERGLLKKDPSLFLKFFKLVKKIKPDIIHSWGAMTTFYAIPSSKYFQIPLFNGQIADAVSNKNRSYFEKILANFNFHFSTKLFSNSKAGLKAYNVNSNKGIVIYNGIRLERFEKLEEKTKIKAKFQIETPLSIIMVGGFNKRKDFKLFIEVARNICTTRNDVTFILVGTGENKVEMEEIINKCNFDRILFTGRILDVEDLVNACDIGVLLTNVDKHAEGIPNAVMEYMALSKPVIATDAGGTIELVSDGISGFLVNSEIDLIIYRIKSLLDDSELRKNMGKNGREIIENCFTIDHMGKEFIKQYLSINDRISG